MHRIRLPGQPEIKLLAIEWYDKPMSFYACVEQLRQLQQICNTTAFEIESADHIYLIDSSAAFCAWLMHVFEGGLDYGFSRRLCMP
jgi:hypothetical protein